MGKPALALLILGSVSIAVFHGLAQIRSSGTTFDEPPHLASGYFGLTSPLGSLNWDSHPPFAQMWAALPLVWLNPDHLSQSPYWGRIINFADAFLYKNRIDPERMLNASRLWNLASLMFFTAAGLMLWAGRLYGQPGAWAAAALAAFCPPLFSNAALVTTDMGSAVPYFLTFFFLAARPRRIGHWIGAGVCCGLAMAAKFNMVALPAFAACALLAESRLEPHRRPSLREVGAALGVIFLAIAAVYRFVQFPRYFEGILSEMHILAGGRGSFVWGHYSVDGVFYYFPVALAVKTPLPILILALGGIILLFKKPDVDGFWIAFPGLAYFTAACASRTQIGYRHILPAYPFVILMACGAATRLWRFMAGRIVLALLAGWLAIDVSRASPYFLAYFNELAGGPSQGYKVLVDSNLDWGQDLKTLAGDVKNRGNPAVFLSYFGVGDPSYYGLRYFPVASPSVVERREGVVFPSLEGPLWLAVSATNLQAVYFQDKNLFGWLKFRAPLFVAGHAIFVYDLTHDADGLEHLAGLLRASGSPAEAERVERLASPRK